MSQNYQANPSVAGYLQQVVSVTADWATVANCKTDIATATGMDIGTPTLDIYFMLWEGSADTDDFAVLKVAKTTGTPTYEDEVGSAATFASAPSSGTSFIIGIYMEN